jgi:hypothetical protein
MSEKNSAFVNELKEIYMSKYENLKTKYDEKLSSEIRNILENLREKSRIGKKEYKWHFDNKADLVNDIEVKIKEFGLYFERGYWDFNPYCLIHWDTDKYNKKLEQLNKNKNKSHLIITLTIITVVLIITSAIIFSELLLLLLLFIPVTIAIVGYACYCDFSDEIRYLKKAAPESD